jgi:class 3 adenylate cyclase
LLDTGGIGASFNHYGRWDSLAPQGNRVIEDRIERKLAAILASDIAGYSRLMGADEEDT